MIRGTTAQFKFHMPYAFDELCVIEITFWQPGKDGIRGPLPIKKVLNRQYIETNTLDVADETKLYYYNGKYYKKEGGEWISSDNIDDLARNDGIAVFDKNDPKTVVTSLNPEETLRFCDTCKGYVQIKGYCDKHSITFGSRPQRFMVYPVKSEDIFENIGQGIDPNTGVQILDAGELK